MSRKPLAGLKVIEIANWVSGPTCGVMLGDYGAEVIKVEHLQTGGDPTRGWIPEPDPPPEHINYVFQHVNRGKRSLALDLGSEKGREVFAKLVGESDVLLTNLRITTAEALGIDYETVSAVNPRLVYGRLTGYGDAGPDRDRPGYDMLSFWARSGLMSVFSPPDEEPLPLPCSLGDVTTGTYMFGGIMMALYERERTGKGSVVDTSLYAAGTWGSAESIWCMLIDGRPLRSITEYIKANPLVQLYRCGDGKWAQLCMLQSDKAWAPFCSVIEMSELAEDARFRTLEDRAIHSLQLSGIVQEQFLREPRDYWAARLDEAGLPWEPVSTVDEVVTHRQMQMSGRIVEVEHPEHGIMKQLAPPYRVNRETFASSEPAPEFGGSTEDVLLGLGYSWEEILGLKEAGVVI